MDNDLKNIWHIKQPDIGLTDEKIDDITKNRSTNIIEKIKKTIKTEHWINIISYPVITVVCLFYGKYWEAALISMVFIPFLIYYRNLLNKLKKVDIQSNVTDYLKSCYEIIHKFVNHYKTIGASTTVIAFFVGLNLTGDFFEIVDKIKGFDLKGQITSILVFILGLVFSIALVIVIIKLLYDKKLKALHTMIEELETSN